MEIIPAIDVIDGKCVRLEKGDFEKKIFYHDDPVEVAKCFEAVGIRRLHIVDLDGAKGQPLKNINTLERVSKNTSLIIDFGGGLKTTENLQSVFDAGATMVSIGSITIKDPDLFAQWIEDFGVENHWGKKIVRTGINTLQPYSSNPPDLLIQEGDILLSRRGFRLITSNIKFFTAKPRRV